MDDIERLVLRVQTAGADVAEKHAAFAELVERFQDMAYGYAYALLGDGSQAEDAAQEAFIAAYRYIGQLEDPRAFPGWFRRIVMSQCSRLTRGKRPSPGSIDEAAELAPDLATPLAALERKELREAILAAVHSLPEAQRLATVLYYIDGYSQDEVAGFLEIPAAAVRKRLQRARGELRERMLEMVRDNLQAGRPSNDERFLQSVKLNLTLEMVALESQLSTLEMLLVDGLDVNAVNREGQTLLHWAAQSGHLEAAELLLRNGADPSIVDRSGRTPQQWAQGKGHRELARLLRRYEEQKRGQEP